ncbi:MAG TPA: hypothetical protein VF719_01500 [Abditibacteriaceae bacterium]|jgi:hypothetical protein
MKAPPTEFPRAKPSVTSPAPDGRISENFTLSDSAVKWAGVLANLAVAYPGSKLSEMSDADISETALIWSDMLADVPTAGIEELYRRTMRRHTSVFPPNPGDFRQAWAKWVEAGYWDEQNPEPSLPPLAALPPGALDRENNLGFIAHSWQRKRMAAGMPAVCCECKDAWGRPIVARLSNDRGIWICGASWLFSNHKNDPDARTPEACAFSWPVKETMRAPERRIPGLKSGPLAQAAVSAVKRPTMSAAEAVLRAAAKECETDYDAVARDPELLALFRGFVTWFRSRYDCSLTRALLEEYFPRWQRAQQGETAGTRAVEPKVQPKEAASNAG